MSGDSHLSSTETERRSGRESSQDEEEKPRDLRLYSRELGPGTIDMCVTTLQSTVAKPEILLAVLKEALGDKTFRLDLLDDMFRISYPEQLDKEELVKRCSLQNKKLQAMDYRRRSGAV